MSFCVSRPTDTKAVLSWSSYCETTTVEITLLKVISELPPHPSGTWWRSWRYLGCQWEDKRSVKQEVLHLNTKIVRPHMAKIGKIGCLLLPFQQIIQDLELCEQLRKNPLKWNRGPNLLARFWCMLLLFGCFLMKNRSCYPSVLLRLQVGVGVGLGLCVGSSDRQGRDAAPPGGLKKNVWLTAQAHKHKRHTGGGKWSGRRR